MGTGRLSLSTYLFTYLFTYLTTYLLNYLSIYLLNYLSIYFIYVRLYLFHLFTCL